MPVPETLSASVLFDLYLLRCPVLCGDAGDERELAVLVQTGEGRNQGEVRCRDKGRRVGPRLIIAIPDRDFGRGWSSL